MRNNGTKQRKAKKPDAEAARERLSALCARSECCEQELRRRLDKWEIGSAEADGIIDFLIDNKFLNEERYARAFASDKARFSLWGRIRIGRELRMRGIAQSAVAEALQEIDGAEYLEALHRASAQCARGLDLTEYTERAKLFRRLASRGYEAELVNREVARLKALAAKSGDDE